ncbi:MAG: UDP-N-acetylmuramoyl-L-alanine--D-glutamate ligase [Spirochaetia bacterium]|nr:UDP-N-acetylmuramoyl-L-alanine--D-glutamate ligase [Spirochaetia bacterium]
MISTLNDIHGLKTTIMGLGLHGGGIASARFFAEHGAHVTVTDLRDEQTLSPSLEKLADLPIRYILGRHENEDFTTADLVIKNPAVPRKSKYLQLARQVETDISVFLRLNKRPLIAVTGSKGKSTTVSALHQIMKAADPRVLLGGNITVSPLTFLEECLSPSISPVILELSSWQLADIQPITLLQPRIAVITNILADHQNSYENMQEYAADKARIFAGQDAQSPSICFFDDSYGPWFAENTPGQPMFYSAKPLPEKMGNGAFLEAGKGYYRANNKLHEIIPEHVNVAGVHNRLNLLVAALIATLQGVPTKIIHREGAAFTGIEHRMELVGVIGGVRWYNDSAATIPDATAAGLQSLKGKIHLIAGGTDKQLDFSPLNAAWSLAASVHLLKGSASDHMQKALTQQHVPFSGPFDNLRSAVLSARSAASPGDAVLFSPGSTSFGMFLNEFDRGRVFKALLEELKELKE